MPDAPKRPRFDATLRAEYYLSFSAVPQYYEFI